MAGSRSLGCPVITRIFASESAVRTSRATTIPLMSAKTGSTTRRSGFSRRQDSSPGRPSPYSPVTQSSFTLLSVRLMS